MHEVLVMKLRYIQYNSRIAQSDRIFVRADCFVQHIGSPIADRKLCFCPIGQFKNRTPVKMQKAPSASGLHI